MGGGGCGGQRGGGVFLDWGGGQRLLGKVLERKERQEGRKTVDCEPAATNKQQRLSRGAVARMGAAYGKKVSPALLLFGLLLFTLSHCCFSSRFGFD